VFRSDSPKIDGIDCFFFHFMHHIYLLANGSHEALLILFIAVVLHPKREKKTTLCMVNVIVLISSKITIQ